jgi:DNA-binding PadR family transcriptional regulator
MEEPAHGYAIVQEIEAREESLPTINPGNLYRRIRDLRSKGLIADAPPAEGEGKDPRRRYFQVTGLGREVGQAEAERLRTLVLEAQGQGLLSEA